jgi:hypothetical protein
MSDSASHLMTFYRNPKKSMLELGLHGIPGSPNLQSAAHCHAAEKMIDTPSLAMGAAGK